LLHHPSCASSDPTTEKIIATFEWVLMKKLDRRRRGANPTVATAENEQHGKQSKGREGAQERETKETKEKNTETKKKRSRKTCSGMK
jgi:hypothetical protein